MADSEWRVLARFENKDDARTVVEHLAVGPEFKAAGGWTSFSRGSKEFLAYAPTSDAVVAVARRVGSRSDSLGVVPVRITVGTWIPNESRWSDDKSRKNPGGADALETAGGVTDLVLRYFFERP